MNRKLKQFFCIFSIIFSLSAISIYAHNDTISVEINGTHLEMSQAPRIIENSTLVPLRDISDALDVTLDWNGNTKTIAVHGVDATYTLEIDNRTVLSENGTLTLNTAPCIIDNKTFVPLRFIAESMGADVVWNNTSKTVSITTNETVERIELTLGNKKIYTGESISNLKKDFGEPNRIEKSIHNLNWYIYNHDYTQFIMVAVKDNMVVGYYTNTKGFVLNDSIYYDAIYQGENDDEQIIFYKDTNNEDKIYAVLVTLLPYQDDSDENEDDSQTFLDVQSRENFDILNTFRTNYGVPILEWDDLLAESANAHCIDMAENGYFSHDSLDGRTHKDRILATGIQDTIAWGENIVAGRGLAVDTFDLWVNSAGHRINMLRKSFTHVGIASVYKEDSVYTYYSGQNFVEKDAKRANEIKEMDKKHTAVIHS